MKIGMISTSIGESPDRLYPAVLLEDDPLHPHGATGNARPFRNWGDLLSGYLSSPEGQMDFSDTLEGNNLKFDVKVQEPMKITLKYALTVNADKLAGTCKMGIFGAAKVSGARASS